MSELAGQLAPRPRWSRSAFIALVVAAALTGAALASVRVGPIPLTSLDVWQALLSADDSVTRQIVWNIRLPRVLVGICVGTNLAVAGVLLQAVMQNPLASPGIVGVTAGAGLAATVVLVLVPGWPTFLPVAAFLGGLATAAVVYSVSWLPGQGTSPLRMVLAGIAITGVLGAVTTFLMVVYSDRVSSVVLWMSGSLNARGWQHVTLIWPWTVGGLILACALLRRLDIIQLGNDVAGGLGLSVERVRLLAIVAAVVLAGSAVSVAGMIGFVGLVVPHMVRLLVGPQHNRVLPIAALGGAALLVGADGLARVVVAPAEIPVGILVALIGGPYFVYLLYQAKFL